jgi:hypothetical protein
MNDEYEHPPSGGVMSAEDQYRIARLYEEVQGRLEEMALIGARVMGIELPPGTVRKFQPVELANESYMVDVEIICPGFGLPLRASTARLTAPGGGSSPADQVRPDPREPWAMIRRAGWPAI